MKNVILLKINRIDKKMSEKLNLVQEWDKTFLKAKK